jgi:Protein of unknown function (DUF3800)
MSITIYVDESGDLGWSFNQPYRSGGSSRHLTIASLIVPNSKIKMPERVIRDLYDNRKWSTSKEKKWSDMSDSARADFTKRVIKLLKSHTDISCSFIVVKKANVKPTLRSDANLLYNYMIHISLVKIMKLHSTVNLVPDPRSIKVESGNSLHDYIQTDLWYREGVDTVLTTLQKDSKKTLNLQFSDMLAGLVQMAYEDSDTKLWDQLKAHVQIKTLFF